MKIFDNILTFEEEERIINCFLDRTFPYFFLYTSVNSEDIKKFKNTNLKIKENNIFSHTFCQNEIKQSDNSHLSDFIFNKFVEKTNIKFNKISRCKLNLQLKNNLEFENFYNTPHIDLNNSHNVLLYYPMDSDGDTLVFDKDFNVLKKVKPKRGRFFLFDGEHYHCGGVPVKNDVRLVLNYDLI